MESQKIANPSPPLARALTSRRLAIVPLAVVGLTLGYAYARTLAPGVTWANDGADSGDLVAAAAVLGVAHPTGYPTYLLLARLFQLIPLGDLAVRTSMLSATAAVLAALCVARLAHRLLGTQSWDTAAAGAGAALALGFAPVFWSQAVIAEVHTLNALFVTLILLFTLDALQRSAPAPAWAARGQAALVGLALGNHITAAGAALAWFGIAALYTPREKRARLLTRRVLWVGLGLLVYLYLPLRARAHPPINWGDPQDWAGFWWVISGQPYRELAFGLPANQVFGRVAAWAALLAQQFGWLGLLLGFFGLLYGAAGARRFVWLSAGVAALASVFAIAYNTADSYAYLIPSYVIFAVWIGLGVERALRAVAQLHSLAAPGAACALAALLAWHAITIAPQVDASQDRRAIAFATDVLAAAPAGAIVIAASDQDAFPLWYYHYALGERSDLVVLVDPLLEFDWYRRNLRAVYPDLSIPNAAETSWVDAITAANRQRATVCHTQLSGSGALECAEYPHSFALPKLGTIGDSTHRPPRQNAGA